MIRAITTVFWFCCFTLTVSAEPALVWQETWTDQFSQTSDIEVVTVTNSGAMLVVIAALSTSNTTITVSSPSASFQQDVSNPHYNLNLAIWSAPNVSSGSHTVTVALSDSQFIRWGAAEFTGIATSSHLIDSSKAFAISDTVTTGDITTSLNDTLLIAAVRTDGDEGAHGDITVGSGFTWIWPYNLTEPNQKLVAEYKVVAAGTHSNGFDFELSNIWVSGMAAYSSSVWPTVPDDPPNRLWIGVP